MHYLRQSLQLPALLLLGNLMVWINNRLFKKKGITFSTELVALTNSNEAFKEHHLLKTPDSIWNNYFLLAVEMKKTNLLFNKFKKNQAS